jgi:hypothetical protein
VKASEHASARVQKRAEAAAAKAQKATNLPTKGLCIASQKSMARPKPKRGALQLQGGEDHGEGPSEPAPKRQELGQSGHLRNILSKPN